MGEYAKQEEQLLPYLSPTTKLSLTDTEDILFRILELKAEYEQWTPKSAKYFADRVQAFRVYIKRKKNVSNNFKEAAVNFTKALHQLGQRRAGQTSRVGDLREYILALNPIRELPWLLEKLDFL